MVIRGIGQAISNQLDEARATLKEVLTHDSENEQAKNALDLIEK